MSRNVTVWIVIADGPGAGPAGDGTWIHRFTRASAAREFASSATCHGGPTLVTSEQVPATVLRRWRKEGKIHG